VGRDWVRGEYSWEKWVGVLSEFYSSLRP
jgi:hypothetical protein